MLDREDQATASDPYGPSQDAPLAEAEERFRRAFEDAPIGMAMVATDGRFLRVNRAFADIVGHPPERLESMDFPSITHPDDLDDDRDHVRRVLEGEISSYEREKRYLRADGCPVWVRINVSLIRGSDGTPRYFIGHVQDIDAVKRREQHDRLLRRVSLAVGEADSLDEALGGTLEAVAEATGWPYGEAWTPSARTGLLECCPRHYVGAEGLEDFRRATEEMRFEPGEGLPGRVWRARTPVWLEDVTADPRFVRAAEAKAAGIRAGFAIPVLSRGESVAVLAFYSFQVRPEDAAMVDMASTVASEVGGVLERKQTEQALRASEERFRSIAEAATEAIVIADDDGLIASWNPGATEIFGYEAAEVVGQPLTILMPERFHEAHWAGLRRVRETGRSELSGQLLELVGCRRDGGEFPLELSLATWETGRGRFFSGIIRDITARREAEEELARRTADLERSNADLQQFAYVASHDLSEPLRVVTGYLELLEKRHAADLGEQGAEFVAYAQGAAARMQELITDLLAYARVGTGEVEREPVDAGAVLDGVLAGLERALDEAGARVEVGELPTVAADGTQLGRIFQNLVSNAVKFASLSPEPPVVRVSAARHGRA